ncbi:putative D-galacturonate reductase [Helianthus anomalus]
MKLPIPNECIASIDIKAVWESMEECQNLGLTKSIGVSNFSSKRIKEILSFAKIPPAVNQVEMNPLWQQKKLNEFCKENGIVVTAYSPLGAAGNSAWGDNHVMECDVLQDVAKSKGKTVAQVFFRITSMHQSGHSGGIESVESIGRAVRFGVHPLPSYTQTMCVFALIKNKDKLHFLSFMFVPDCNG